MIHVLGLVAHNFLSSHCQHILCLVIHLAFQEVISLMVMLQGSLVSTSPMIMFFKLVACQTQSMYTMPEVLFNQIPWTIPFLMIQIFTYHDAYQSFSIMPKQSMQLPMVMLLYVGTNPFNLCHIVKIFFTPKWDKKTHVLFWWD